MAGGDKAGAEQKVIGARQGVTRTRERETRKRQRDTTYARTNSLETAIADTAFVETHQCYFRRNINLTVEQKEE